MKKYIKVSKNIKYKTFLKIIKEYIKFLNKKYQIFFQTIFKIELCEP